MEKQVKKLKAAAVMTNHHVDASAQTIEIFLRFERLLSDLSAHFVRSMSSDEVDRSIENGLKMILDFFRGDRCSLFQIFADKNSWKITHAAYVEGVIHIPMEVEFPESITPWGYDLLVRKRRVLSFSKLDELPDEAKIDKQAFNKWHIRSNLAIPILTVQHVDHFIAISSVRGERNWPEEYIPRLRLLGEVFVNALERNRIRQQVEERLRFESLVTDLSAGFMAMQPEEIDDPIRESLRSIAEFFDVDRCTIGIFSENGTRLTRTFEYHSAKSESAPEFIIKDQWPWYIEQLIRRIPVVIHRIEDLPPEAEKERQYCLLLSVKSLLSIPIVSGGKTLGALTLVSTRVERVWAEEYIQRLRLLGEIIVNVLERAQNQLQLGERLQEIQKLKQQLEVENTFLQGEVQNLSEHKEIVGRSPAIKSVLAQVQQVGGTEATVLIQGETGTGKELLARAIHSISGRNHRPMVTVNCASLPPALIESELFGRERGAYTGALTKMVGRFEMADGSTLFLDEIAEIPLELQSKLLRVLQEGTFERLGSTKTFHTNVRIIAASNRKIEKAVKEGKFRDDLFYRLNVFPILIPPLRERLEDIPLLVWTFVEEFQRKMGKRVDRIPSKEMEALQAYSWPGNIRELRNIIERAIIISNSPKLHIPIASIPSEARPDKDDLQEIERNHILKVLEKTNWRLMGKGGAAESLGLKRTTLQSKMKKLGLTLHKDLPK